MKTRMITSTMVVLFATVTLVSATTSRTINPLVASSHENATEQSYTEMIPNNAVSAGTILMEDWIDSRDNWEQLGVENANIEFSDYSEALEEWMVSRDNWEQQDEKVENPLGITSVLEDWTARAENWEQK